MAGTPQSLANLPEGLDADAIDTLPVLAALFSQLQPLSPNTGTSGSPAPAGASPFNPISPGPLLLKDVPAATDHIKHKLHKARVQVRELPDMQRTVEEQEVEIRELEDKIRAQRRVLEQFRDIGVQARERRNRVVGDAMET
ncbi:hypothetical protein B7494_g4310 [Chlorociboria aeruginascens]|nr:hypothetical protein B7494_g4310 [Chlorociboria aeruginascens]